MEFGDKFRIIDIEEQLSCANIVATQDRAFADPTINACRDIDTCGVGFTLDNERLWLNQIPQRKTHDCRHDYGDDDSWRP
jgi:hypothetical protein